MQCVEIKNLQPSMVLMEDITDRSGRLLVKAHTTLTEKHISVLKTWGIAQAYIKGEEDQKPTEEQEIAISPAAYEQAQEIAQYLFSKTNIDHPAMKTLFDLCVRRLAKKLSKRGF